MSRIPAVSIYGDRLTGERTVVAVDLDRVDVRIRVDLVRELALGSSPAPEWSNKQSRLHEIKPVGLFGRIEHSWGDLPAIFFGLLIFLAWMYVLGLLGPWAAGIMAAIVLALALPWTAAERRRPVDFRDAIVAQVKESDLGPGAQNSLRRVEAAVGKLYDVDSPALTDEMWLLAYQVGADLAVAGKMRTVGDPDTEEAATRLERRAVEIANQFDTLVHNEIERPEQLRAAAVEEQRRQATRADLAGYMGPELPGRYTADIEEVADRFEVLPGPSTSGVDATTEVPGSEGEGSTNQRGLNHP